MKMEQKDEDKTIEELSGEKHGCYGCGVDLSGKKPDEVFIDPFFFEWFASVFCTQTCRDNYINSK